MTELAVVFMLEEAVGTCHGVGWDSKEDMACSYKKQSFGITTLSDEETTSTA